MISLTHHYLLKIHFQLKATVVLTVACLSDLVAGRPISLMLSPLAHSNLARYQAAAAAVQFVCHQLCS